MFHILELLRTDALDFEYFNMASLGRNVTADDLKCDPLAINQFPPDIFSANQREHGAILLHFGAAFYMFGAVAYLCNEYFVPTLEFLVERFKIKPHVAGATIMAVGNSSPQLFTSLIGVFIAKDDVGLGAIVGSAVFNSLFVIGCCVLVSGSMSLEVYSLIRDSFYYFLALIPLEIVCWDHQVTWYEALILVVMYCGFILVMYLNQRIESRVNKRFPSLVSKRPLCPPEEEKFPIILRNSGSWMAVSLDSKSSVDNSNVALRQPTFYGSNQGNYSGPTKLSRVSYRNANEESSFTENIPETDEETTVIDAENNNWCSQFSFPEGTVGRILWVLGLPIIVTFACTIPNPKQDCYRKLYPLTFIMSLVYIGLLSYLLVWMVTVIGYTIGIPDIILGLVFLSAGSSVTDALGSIIVARHGKGDMAVSNCIGSNVYDISIGLGLPWLLKTTVFGAPVKIYSASIHFTILILLGSMIAMNVVFITSKWSPRRLSGLALLFLYVGLITLACLIEMNVIIKSKYSLPPCES